MSVCVFDNPATMAREAWQEGVLVGHTQAALLESATFRGHRDWPFIFNVGRWEPGRVHGDAAAIGSAR